MIVFNQSVVTSLTPVLPIANSGQGSPLGQVDVSCTGPLQNADS